MCIRDSDQTYKLSNLLFNGVFAGGSGTLHGVLATYGNRNSIHVDKVTSVHSEVITYWNFGKQEDWVITNCKAKTGMATINKAL